MVRFAFRCLASARNLVYRKGARAFVVVGLEETTGKVDSGIFPVSKSRGSFPLREGSFCKSRDVDLVGELAKGMNDLGNVPEDCLSEKRRGDG
jgi:hypothetical protein